MSNTTSTKRQPAKKKGEDEVGSKKYFEIPVKMIAVEDGFNQRLDYGSDDFETLKNSIKNKGVQEPIRVVPDPKNKNRFILREGHRRMRAVELLIKAGINIKKVPAMISHKESPEQSFVRMISANSGKSFSKIEQGLVFTKLVEAYKYSVKEVAEETGHGENHVYYCMKLAEAPRKYHKSMADGSLSHVLVTNVMRECKDTPEKMDKVLEDALKRAEKEHRREIKNGKSPKEKKKVTAKHVKGIAAVSPLQKVREAIMRAEKNKNVYDQKKVEFLDLFFTCLDNKGTVDDLCELLKK